MSWRTLAFLVLLIVPVLACNLSSQTNNPAATPSQQAIATTLAGAPPQVVIEAPANGSQVVVQKPFKVQVHATDSVGITRVEMRESGRVVVSQPSPDPKPDLSVQLTYVPVNTGPLTLEVIAYGQSTVSSPAALNLEVVASDADLKNPGSFDPTTGAAAGPICTVRPTLPLSLRVGPGVNYRLLLTLRTGEDLVVIGRNADTSWYQVKRSDATIGWVSAPYVSVDGDCSKAPVATAAL